MAGSHEKLIARAQAGERQAFDLLVRESYPLIYNTAYRLLGDADRAADATQTAFVRAYRSITSFRGSSSFSTWLYRIVTNVCLDMLRQQGPGLESLTQHWEDSEDTERDIPDHHDQPEQAALQAEVGRLVHQALGRLRPEQRAVLVLYDLAGLSYEEIAEVLKLPLGTVKSRLNRARNALREEMLPYRELM